MVALPLSSYAHALRGAIPARVFHAAPGRLWWLGLHIAIATLGVAALAAGVGGWLAAPFLSLVIGHSYACAGFVAHETLHGSVVRDRRLKLFVGWVGFLPFLFSPRMWIAWHNKLHHAHTADEKADPDTYGTLDDYRRSRVMRTFHPITPGEGHWAGWLTLLLGFSVQGTKMLLSATSVLRLPARERRAAVAETAAAVALWAGLALLLGPARFVFAYVLPMLVANTILTGYILTNHCLSPLTTQNDPLLNSLSVTTPRIIEIMHLNFGYHVEHHVFPSMSPRHAPLVRRALRERWPDRYQTLPIGRALWRIFTSSRLYGDPRTLVNPASGHEFATLAPRVSAPRAPEPRDRPALPHSA